MSNAFPDETYFYRETVVGHLINIQLFVSIIRYFTGYFILCYSEFILKSLLHFLHFVGNMNLQVISDSYRIAPEKSCCQIQPTNKKEEYSPVCKRYY